MMNRGLHRNAGFAVLEAAVAMFVIAALGILAIKFAINVQQSSHQAKAVRKAAALADMVYERISGSDAMFTSLASQSGQTPEQFFGATPDGADSKAYSGFYISTEVNSASAANPNLKEIKVHITQPSVPGRKFTFVKYVSATNMSLGGGSVQVYVKAFGTGTPIQGAEVRAPHFVAALNEVVEYTDASGFANLKNVRLSASANAKDIQITVRTPGSAATVKAIDPNYRKGYYVSNGGYTTEATRMTTVMTYPQPPEVFKDFRPMASIKGVTRESGSNAAVGNMEVTLNALASDGVAGVSRTWGLRSDPSGAYELNNVLPGNVDLQPRTHWGSAPEIPLGAAGFDQGWSHDASSGHPVPMPHPAVDQLSEDVKYVKMGRVKLLTIDDDTKSPISVSVPIKIQGDYYFRWDETKTFTTNAAGVVELGNVAIRTADYEFDAWLKPGALCSSSLNDLGFYLPGAQQTQPLEWNKLNYVTLNLVRGRRAHGVAVNAATNAPLAGMTVTARGLDQSQSVAATTAADGSFSLCGVRTLSSANDFQLRFMDSNIFVTGTALPGSILVKETAFGQAVAGMTLQATAPNSSATVGACGAAVSGTPMSDAAGQFGDMCLRTTFVKRTSLTVDPNTFPLWELGNVPLEVNKADFEFTVSQPAPAFFSAQNGSILITNGGTYVQPPVSVYPTLVSFPIKGTVKDKSTGAPLAGITISSPNQGSTTTDAAGQYAMNGNVYWRWTNDAGYIQAKAVGGISPTTGYLYDTVSKDGVAMPATFDFATPITMDFILTPQGSGL